MPTKKQRRASSAKTPSRQKLTEAERKKAEAEVPSADRTAFEKVMQRLVTTPPKGG
jgi:hypothetical protein